MHEFPDLRSCLCRIIFLRMQQQRRGNFRGFGATFNKKYLPLTDTEYPYAGIPRIVIETENRSPVKDRKNEIPAKLQIWGENSPESEVMDLTIRGRGHTSWSGMPKKSYKIEFTNKQAMLGMPGCIPTHRNYQNREEQNQGTLAEHDLSCRN